MIGGILSILIAVWIYQSAVKAKIANITMWWAGAAIVFLITQFVLIGINVSMFDLDGTKTESKTMLSTADETCKKIEADKQKTSSKKDDKDGDMGQFKDSSCSNVHGEDRQDKERFSGFSGAIKSLYFELSPYILSFLLIAFLRVKFITKEAIAVDTLLGGLSEMFQGIYQNIAQSFKSSSK
jgi:hypothetical protein